MSARVLQTLLLAAIAALLVGYYLLFESDGSPQTQSPPAARDLFTDLSLESIVKVEISSTERGLTVFKDNEGWHVEHPRQAKADLDEVARLISILSMAKYQRRLSLSGLKRGLEEFGLTHPSMTVAVTQASQTGKSPSTQEVLLGQQSPSGLQVYAIRPGGQDLLLVDSETVNQIKYFIFIPPVARSAQRSLPATQNERKHEEAKGKKGR